MFVTENKLLILSIILSLAGIVLLFVVREAASNPLSYDEFLDANEVFVVLEGQAVRVQTYEWGSRFLLETSCSVPVISSQDLQEGPVVVYGSKRFYQGRPEVSAQRIVSE